MIVASIFQKLFDGMTLTYNEYKPNLIDFKEVTKPVQYGYGDSKELAKWLRGRSGRQKYPLVWCIIEPRDNSSVNTIRAKVCFYLFTSTKTSYYNDTRSRINYSNILDKLSDQIYNLISTNGAISLIYRDYERAFLTEDKPNFGLDADERDWDRKELKGTRSVTIDIVDARKVDFQARFDKSCLI